jgi:L-fuconolactonase
MKKGKDNRNEEIIEPDLPIIDAHHHLMEMFGVRYLLEDFLEDVNSGHNIRASIYCESHSMFRVKGPELFKAVGETEFAKGIGVMSDSGAFGDCRVNAGIISFANLQAGDAISEVLDAHLSAGGNRMKGIRQVGIWHPSEDPYFFIKTRPKKGIYSDTKFHQGFSKLEERGLTFDAAVFHHQLDEVCFLADMFPNTAIILNHMGFAMAMGKNKEERKVVFADWKKSLVELSNRLNVKVKVGGLGMPFWGFGFNEKDHQASYLDLAEIWRPYVETSIEIFGIDRCIMESNFPADGHSCGYVPLWNALKFITISFSKEEKTKLYFDNAVQTYNLDASIR